MKSKGKSYKHMDPTSGSMAKFLDAKREAQKKRNAQRKLYDRSSLSRGGFR